MIITSPTLTKAVREVCSVAIAHREVTEDTRKLAPEVVEKLITHKLFRLGLPKSLGGWEDNPVEVLKAYEELGSAEAAVAWIAWNNHLACTFGRFLDESSMNEIYSNPSHVYANSTRPEGFAKVVPGGYMVSGQWTLVSGCELADWFALRCLVLSEDLPSKLGPGAKLKIVYLPKDAITVIDTWNVGGLKGTGSHDVKVKEIFVPQNYAVDFDSEVHIDHAYSRLPIGCMNSAGCAAMALGIVKSAIDELIKMGHERVTPGKNPDLRDRPPVQVVVADSVAIISATRSHLYDCVNRLWEESLDGNTFSDTLLADVWTAAHKAATTARSTMSDIYAVAGTSSLYTKSPIERAHRDIHAVLQHGIIQPHWMNQAGMAYLGLKPSAAMFWI
jgi:alkylation response protein AidB-like acyl-CoA dehydrogenase